MDKIHQRFTKMKNFIEELKVKIEILCIDHPLLITFAIGFILGAAIF
jgi:hypothetical protein